MTPTSCYRKDRYIRIYSSLEQSRSRSNEIRRAQIFCRNRNGVLMHTFYKARSHFYYLDARCHATKNTKR